jgi:ABC-2 type transport system permease protein
MDRVWAIFKKEFTGYFNSLMAYFFLVVFLLAVNVLYVWFMFFRSRVPVMNDYFELAIIGFWLFIPAITMRMWAEEKKLGTLELLMTMPVRDGEAVAGKFLASFAFLLLTLLLSFVTIPTALAYVGQPDFGPIIGGYVGLLLLGTSFIAVGLAISSMTENQFIAFLLTSIICLALLGISEILQMIPMPGWLLGLVSYLDAGTHFDSIGRGVIDSRDIVYYLSVICFFLFLNYRAVTSRRWK